MWHTPQIDTNGGVCKDGVLKSMSKTSIGEVMCFLSSSKARLHELNLENTLEKMVKKWHEAHSILKK